MLRAMDKAEKQVFAARGMAALLIEERQLYRLEIDPEVDDYFVSFDAWLKSACPESWGEVRRALRAVKELRDLPFEDLLQMPRCNVEQLKSVSSNVRALPEVIRAAKSLSEKALVAKLNGEHHQHLEARTAVRMVPAGDAEEERRAIEIAMVLEQCATEAEARKAIFVSYIIENEEVFNQLREG